MRGRCKTMLFLCKMKSLLELVEGSAFPTVGLKSLSCLPRCHLAYFSKTEFGGGIVDGRLWGK